MTMAAIDVEEVAILGIELYFPRLFVEQQELEVFDEVQPGKYTVGLGQQRMAFPSPAEDSISMAMTVFARLLERHPLCADRIGRLEVGSESNPDRAKSIKSHLMSLMTNDTTQFVSVTGADCVQACQGGSAAYLNALSWLSSPLCSRHRPLAVVVASDVAVYAPGPARATGGAAAVALLLGRVPRSEAAIRCELRPMGSAAGHVYDFYKAAAGSEYPLVDGPLSVECYLRAVEASVRDYCGSGSGMGELRNSLGRGNAHDHCTLGESRDHCAPVADLILFHTPFSKIAHKALKRLQVPVNVQEASLKCLRLTGWLGNSYCASLYVNLLYCLIEQMKAGESTCKKLLMVSYGSGLMASAFGITVNAWQLTQHCPWLSHVSTQLDTDLADRKRCSPEEFERILGVREEQFREPRGWKVTEEMRGEVREGAYYLAGIDDQFRRQYMRK